MKKPLLFIYMFALLQPVSYSQWAGINSFPLTYTKDIIKSGSTFYVCSLNDGVYKSTDGTVSWQQVNNGLVTAQALSVYQLLLTGNALYAATVDGIYKSVNNGANWVKKSSGIAIGGGALYESTQSIFEHNGILFTGAWTGIYRSTNGGENWISTNITGTAILAKSFTDHQGIFFAAREVNNTPVGYKSTDNGVTWSPITNFSFSMITFFSESVNLWTGTIHGAWLSTNSGSNWINRSTGLPPDPYNSSFVRVNGVLISSVKFGGSGVYSSTNDGLQWVNAGAGLPFLLEISKLIIHNDKLIASTSSGLYQRVISEITGVSPVSSETPNSFKLYQNYPNPFNPVTKIRFSVSLTPQSPLERGRGVTVRLTIFDILGKEVTTLVPPLLGGQEGLTPGTYEVDWDASNYPSGVYYYRLEADGYLETKKMVLVK